MNFDDAKKLLEENGQEHILKAYSRLDENGKKELLEQISRIDFTELNKLYQKTKEQIDMSNSVIEPIDFVDSNKLTNEEKAEYTKLGEEAIKNGKYAVVIIAGGQGTRLGHSGPKGTFDIGLKSHKSIFEIQNDILKEAKKRYGVTIPCYTMTSRSNRKDTVDFYEKNNFFGYPKSEINYFFNQSELPMLDEEGKIIIDEKGFIKEGPDGHGGVFKAMVSNGILDDMKKRGIEWFYIAAVDNVLSQLADPVFIGFAIKNGYKAASKTIPKTGPNEHVGVFCKKNGKPYVIEYTEISEELANMKDKNGELVYGEAHMLLNLFNIELLEEIAKFNLPYHVAHKKSSYMNENGEVIVPDKPNAYKFETFIFDAFSMLPEVGLLRGNREVDFSVVKNAEGVDSPETARRDYLKYHHLDA